MKRQGSNATAETFADSSDSSSGSHAQQQQQQQQQQSQYGYGDAGPDARLHTPNRSAWKRASYQFGERDFQEIIPEHTPSEPTRRASVGAPFLAPPGFKRDTVNGLSQAFSRTQLGDEFEKPLNDMNKRSNDLLEQALVSDAMNGVLDGSHGQRPRRSSMPFLQGQDDPNGGDKDKDKDKPPADALAASERYIQRPLYRSASVGDTASDPSVSSERSFYVPTRGGGGGGGDGPPDPLAQSGRSDYWDASHRSSASVGWSDSNRYYPNNDGYDSSHPHRGSGYSGGYDSSQRSYYDPPPQSSLQRAAAGRGGGRGGYPQGYHPQDHHHQDHHHRGGGGGGGGGGYPHDHRGGYDHRYGGRGGRGGGYPARGGGGYDPSYRNDYGGGYDQSYRSEYGGGRDPYHNPPPGADSPYASRGGDPYAGNRSPYHQQERRESYGPEGPPSDRRGSLSASQRSTFVVGSTTATTNRPRSAAMEGLPKLVYKIKFKRDVKDFVPSPKVANRETPLPIGSYVKVEADRGEDLGIVVDCLDYASAADVPPLKNTSKDGSPKKVLRLAKAEEVAYMEQKASEEQEMLDICREKCALRGLPMNMVDAEYQFDKNKLSFYFEAERRVDFRDLVRELFMMCGTRIWMCQIHTGATTQHRRRRGPSEKDGPDSDEEEAEVEAPILAPGFG